MQEGQKNGIVLQKKHIFIGIAVVVVLIAASTALAFNWNSWFSQSTGKLDLDPNAAAWRSNAKIPKADDAASGIAIPGYSSISFPANTKNVQMVLLNPENNPCYFQFEIRLREGNETIYTSKLVPPGQAITNLTLTRGLEPGEYEAVIGITTTSLVNGGPMNGANAETKFIVK